ncbi:hypothetical protein [Blastopirellula marina]|uniref:Uncharacterized protein n=1 Tax=Blastopirellula marina TaxID=124 RepID=A0A2S8GDZ8_9BACT|nr:hypothetical protein [Blastopirellula marina]PQO42687.1 hypothetical protein C5Y98_00605 [Blastopirellula marina]PTL46453.1 hypothetical protein C5Y97_00605 [Blastopirellula marina]
MQVNLEYNAQATPSIANLSRIHLIDLAGLITWVAILCAVVKPWIVSLSISHQLTLVGYIVVQILVFLVSVVFAQRRRKVVLSQGETWFGSSENGRGAGWVWRLLKGMATLSCSILGMSITTGYLATLLPIIWILYVVSLLVPWRSGKSFVRLRLGNVPGAVEFFERGVVLRSLCFVPWQRTKLKPWRGEPNRLVVVVLLPKNSKEERVYDVNVSKTLWCRLRDEGRLLDYEETHQAHHVYEPARTWSLDCCP